MTAVLAARNVRKAYGEVQALTAADLTAQAGQIVAMLGLNGAGKTTMTRVITGLDSRDAGEVEILGLDPARHTAELAGLVGCAGQEIALFPTATVDYNLSAFAMVRGFGRGGSRAEIERIASLFQLTKLLDRKVGVLSGGEQRRVHTAAAFIGSPRLILLDEPTAGADVELRDVILAATRDAVRTGAAIVYCTHYLDEAEAVADDVMIMEAGRTLCQQPVADVVALASAAVEIRFAGECPAELYDHRTEPDLLVLPAEEPTLSRAMIDRILALPIDVRSISMRAARLEDIFRTLVTEART